VPHALCGTDGSKEALKPLEDPEVDYQDTDGAERKIKLQDEARSALDEASAMERGDKKQGRFLNGLKSAVPEVPGFVITIAGLARDLKTTNVRN
jgi:hypothetical protein